MSSILPRIVRRLLRLTASLWGIVAVTAYAAGDDDASIAPPSLQVAGLTPEQREELRNQVREHRERAREEYREMPRNAAPTYEQRQQRLSPDERQEFRQWMRERRGGGWRNERGRG